MTRRATVIAVSHGGGPLPILGDPSQAKLASSLRTAVPKALRFNTPDAPSCFLIVTAHWQTDVVTISSGAQPQLLYDYYGFPQEAYELTYPAPGAPDVAKQVQAALRGAGIASELDASRGWDHGVFVPLMLVHPQADIPVVQLSVLASQDPTALLAVGRALAPLRDQNVAIVGSGMASMHNMGVLMGRGGPQAQLRARTTHGAWMQAVREAAGTAPAAERAEKFARWREWEGAYDAHPRGQSEHFSPLVVCAGAAGDEKSKSWVDEAMGWGAETFYWDG